MEIEEILRVGQHLDCAPSDGVGADQRCPARVARLEPEAIVLTLLGESSHGPSFPADTQVLLDVIKGQALYRVRGRVSSSRPGEIAVSPEGEPELMQKRSYMRVEDSFRVHFRILPREEYERRRQDFATRSSKRGEARSLLPTDWSGEFQEGLGEEAAASLEAVVIKMLIGLDRKLDKVIDLLEQPKGRAEFCSGTGVNISGAGICFVTEAPVGIGSMLELAIEFNVFPPIHLMALGKTLRAREMLDFPETQRHFEVAVEFSDIHEDDRDEVIRYTFRRQRELLRSQKLGTPQHC